MSRLRAAVSALCLAATVARGPTAEAKERALVVRVSPASPAVAGHPLRVFVAIKNNGRSRLLFAAPGTPNLKTHWFRYSFSTEEIEGRAMGGGGGTMISSSHDHGTELCPRPEDVLGLDPGAELIRVAEVPLPSDLPAGPARFTVEVELARLTPDLRCTPLVLVAGSGRAIVRVQAPAAK